MSLLLRASALPPRWNNTSLVGELSRALQCDDSLTHGLPDFSSHPVWLLVACFLHRLERGVDEQVRLLDRIDKIEVANRAAAKKQPLHMTADTAARRIVLRSSVRL